MPLPNGPSCSSCILGGATKPEWDFLYGSVIPGDGFMKSPDDMRSGVMFCAEALGAQEAQQEEALVGPSGFLLGRAMARRGYKREEVNYQNLLRCRPPGNQIRDKRGKLHPWAQEAIEHCTASYLHPDINRLKPKAIVAFGDTAFHHLTGEFLPMMAGRGYVFPALGHPGVWVVPTFHPAYILRGNQGLALTLMWDMAKAMRIAKEGFEYDNPICLNDPSLEEWEAFVEYALEAIERGVPLGLDIETPYKSQHSDDEDELEVEDPSYTIDRISFAVGGEKGASVLWQMPFLIGIKRLIVAAAAKSTILIWNRPYDYPRVVKALDIIIPISRTRDTMDAWHVLYNILPRKLGFATSCLPSSWNLRAWKHLANVEPAYYSTVDAIALWRNDDDIRRLLAQTGQKGVFTQVCEQLDPVLSEMAAMGLLVDTGAQDALRTLLDGAMSEQKAKMSAVVPDAVRPLKVWKTQRAADKGLLLLKGRSEVEQDAALFPVPATELVKTCSVCGSGPVTKAHVAKKTLVVE